MIVTRTPFRITLGGGGTDLPSYYTQRGGFIFAAGIDKYMFVNINKPIVDDLVRLKYAKTEIVDHIDKLEHEIAREGLRMMGIERAIEVDSIADLPAGIGLGSSSAYAVGLLHALHTLKRNNISFHKLAEKACKLEMDILKKPIGKQDQFMAAFGGLTVLDIGKDGQVKVRNAKVSHATIEDLQRNLLAFYTGVLRKAEDILLDQKKGAEEKNENILQSLDYIKDIGYQILDAVETGNLTNVGLLFDKHWEYKKKMSSKISRPEFDKIYEIAKAKGALGGKISGAGGGGFFLFYIEKDHAKFRKAMEELGLREMRFNFDFEGSKILANF